MENQYFSPKSARRGHPEPPSGSSVIPILSGFLSLPVRILRRKRVSGMRRIWDASGVSEGGDVFVVS